MLPGTGRARPRPATHPHRPPALRRACHAQCPPDPGGGCLRAIPANAAASGSSARHTSTPRRRLRRACPIAGARARGRAWPGPSRRRQWPGYRRGPPPRPSPVRNAAEPRERGEPLLDVGLVAHARANAADHAHAQLSGARTGAYPGPASAAASPRARTHARRRPDGFVSPEHQHRACLDGDAGQPARLRQARQCVDRSPACRRAAPDRASAPWSARRRAARVLARALHGDALEHGVGAFRTLDRQHTPRATATAWPASSGPSAARTAKPSTASARSRAERATAPCARHSATQGRRNLMRTAHGEALALEEAHDPRQHESSPPASRPTICGRLREQARIRAQLPQVRTAHAARDDQLVARSRRAASPPCGRSGPS